MKQTFCFVLLSMLKAPNRIQLIESATQEKNVDVKKQSSRVSREQKEVGNVVCLRKKTEHIRMKVVDMQTIASDYEGHFLQMIFTGPTNSSSMRCHSSFFHGTLLLPYL